MMLRTAFVAILLVLFAAGASAQLTGVSFDTTGVSSKTIGVGPQVGYYKSSGADAGALYVGASMRLKFGTALAAEASLGYRGKQDFKFGTVGGNELSAKLSTIPITVSGMVFIVAQSGYIPYIVAGAGMYIVTVDYSTSVNQSLPDETKAKFGLHLGLGIEVPVNRNMSFTGDYRYLFLGKIFDGNAQYDFSGKDYGGSTLTAGLLVYF